MNLPTHEDWDKMYATNGQFAFRKMFLELSRTDQRERYPPLFTLKPYEYKGLPSAYLVYMSSVDEYDAATKLVPHMKVWDELLNTSWWITGDKAHNFEGIQVWRDHMKLRDVSQAKAALQDRMKTGDVTASKAILAETRVKAPVGRKSKKKSPEQKQTDSRILEFRKKSKI